MEVLRKAQEAIIQDLKKGIPKTVNFQVHQIMQEPKESPTDFLIHLKDGFQCFTDLNSDAPQNEVFLKMTFVGQSTSDIRRKLQKLDAPITQTLELLIQTTFIIYSQREEKEEEKEDKKMKKQATLLEVALQTQPKKGLPIFWKFEEKPMCLMQTDGTLEE
ncbi:hypothetical protein E2320_002085 [Naja naja]|nr:hypothetical protein E2320_002085 [Naja naja]